MGEKTLEKNDNGIGRRFEVKKNTGNSNRITFSSKFFGVGDNVYILTESERFDIMNKIIIQEQRASRLRS